ncbi:aminoglycoside phosphotransferase (APT) family kinase protein [Agromyces terreus]|uniref:Aminoglycoside phosphotransferase (APT) family kinase protein n=1 Tax=Agromyces terreus TaxID=424795 RepID=A0A9X2KDE9_9MICO|nr:phosphotransferase [Agromyces terreus]MCP2372371.1 aminoglycoside phosphotransferase (APT) family kinase protein [Agromyces terreus]
MARPTLTLAALATAAIPGLEVTAARARTRRSAGAFDAAELHTSDGRRLLIRVPRSQSAETEQSADLVALAAMTAGVRSRLPFSVPIFAGQAPIDGTRAVVTDFLDGGVVSGDDLTAHDRIAESVGAAIAAIHSLPTGFVGDAGLPRETADESRDAVVALIGRASDTGHLPAALLRRWEEATDDAALWRFRPAVVNGSLSPDSFLVDEERVLAVIGWSAIAVGDPAQDLHWLLTSRGASAERALEAYILGRGGAADALLPQRALLYGELELARWLLHGVERHDERIIADAVEMLDNLVASVHEHTTEALSPATGPILTVDGVERLLDETPRSNADASTREPASAMLTDSYDFSDLERDEVGERSVSAPDATAPIPLDLSDWGDAAPAAAEPARASAEAGPGASDPNATAPLDQATIDQLTAEAQARRNAASS